MIFHDTLKAKILRLWLTTVRYNSDGCCCCCCLVFGGLWRSFPHFGEEFHERVVDHESNGNVQTYAAHPRYGSFVKSIQEKLF